MNNNFGILFFNLLCNLGDYSNIQTIHCSTRFLVPIIAITPFEQVLAVPDLEFLVRLHHQGGGEEKLSKSSCGDSVVAQGRLQILQPQ